METRRQVVGAPLEAGRMAGEESEISMLARTASAEAAKKAEMEGAARSAAKQAEADRARADRLRDGELEAQTGTPAEDGDAAGTATGAASAPARPELAASGLGSSGDASGACAEPDTAELRLPHVAPPAPTRDECELARPVQNAMQGRKMYSMDNPRAEGLVDVVAFYHPGRDELWDRRCKCGFLGNFWHMGQDALKVTARGAQQQDPSEQSFSNAEAAFQALKFWHRSQDFRQCDGSGAFDLKRQLQGQEDFSYGSTGSNWAGMLLVLRAKYGIPSYANALKATDDTFLLEHNSTPGRDKVWSDNFNGEGTNWLGLQLMLICDEINDKTDVAGSWTAWLTKYCSLNTATGEFGTPRGADAWQNAVSAGTKNVLGEQTIEFCAREGCGKPTWNGKRGEYCSRGCRQFPDRASRGEQSIECCAREGCGKPSWNGKRGEYCSRSCRQFPAQASRSPAVPMSPAVQVCGRPGCQHPTWDGQPGFCSVFCQNQIQQSQDLQSGVRASVHQQAVDPEFAAAAEVDPELAAAIAASLAGAAPVAPAAPAANDAASMRAARLARFG